MNGSRASGATMCDRGVTFCEGLDVCAGSHGWDSRKASRLGRPRCVIGVSLSEGSPTEETDFVETVHAKPQQKKVSDLRVIVSLKPFAHFKQKVAPRRGPTGGPRFRGANNNFY